MLRKTMILIVIFGLTSLSYATLFEEHVTDGTLDENWTDIVDGSASWSISSEQSVSPDYSRKGVNGTASYNGCSIATDLELPDSYVFSAYVYSITDNPERAAIWFNVVSTPDADGTNEYELFLWHGDLLLGKRVNGAWNGLESKSGVSAYQQWRELKVEVSYNGTSTTIVTYLDGQLVTWDSGDTFYTDTGVGSVDPYHGGTIGIHRNGAGQAYFDDIVVVPEPATIGFVIIGLASLLKRRK